MKETPRYRTEKWPILLTLRERQMVRRLRQWKSGAYVVVVVIDEDGPRQMACMGEGQMECFAAGEE